nr:immunoglobulin heavy chain junction region [Macaca mulatta]
CARDFSGATTVATLARFDVW